MSANTQRHLNHPARITLPGGLDISRLVCGLWQVADIEKAGHRLDPDIAANDLEAYAKEGFDTFDMADHYGSAEVITGSLLKRYPRGVSRPTAFTKWCPEPGPMTADVVRAGVQERLDRLGVETVDLLQFHWWSFEHPAWIDALHEMKALRDEGLIRNIGVTNFDAAHLALALADGIPIATNQVSFSLVDRRAALALSDLCASSSIRLLAYGTLCGGFLSEKWVGKPEPARIDDWSKSKYKRFIDAAGGWEAFQTLLGTVAEIAQKHRVSVSNVATAWVLGHDSVAAAIIGARLGESQHREDNLHVFDVSLDTEDHDRLNTCFAGMTPIPGDCGDEYRRPPFLTASGDLSHHLQSIPSAYAVAPHSRPDGLRVSTGSI
ncbi:MAG: aldo/keto reductase, partial [Alphaproteobacteria bacterium]|nr:aldo/keto reductase [Alphaproteobacteria bacterium]